MRKPEPLQDVNTPADAEADAASQHSRILTRAFPSNSNQQSASSTSKEVPPEILDRLNRLEHASQNALKCLEQVQLVQKDRDKMREEMR